MAQSSEQLINTAQLFIKLGKVEQARKIARKLIAQHRPRLKQLSSIDMSNDNYNAVMAELNEIQYLVKR